MRRWKKRVASLKGQKRVQPLFSPSRKLYGGDASRRHLHISLCRIKHGLFSPQVASFSAYCSISPKPLSTTEKMSQVTHKEKSGAKIIPTSCSLSGFRASFCRRTLPLELATWSRTWAWQNNAPWNRLLLWDYLTNKTCWDGSKWRRRKGQRALNFDKPEIAPLRIAEKTSAIPPVNTVFLPWIGWSCFVGAHNHWFLFHGTLCRKSLRYVPRNLQLALGNHIDGLLTRSGAMMTFLFSFAGSLIPSLVLTVVEHYNHEQLMDWRSIWQSHPKRRASSYKRRPVGGPFRGWVLLVDFRVG